MLNCRSKCDPAFSNNWVHKIVEYQCVLTRKIHMTSINNGCVGQQLLVILLLYVNTNYFGQHELHLFLCLPTL